MNPIIAKMTDSGWTGIVIGYMEGGMEMEHIYIYRSEGKDC